MALLFAAQATAQPGEVNPPGAELRAEFLEAYTAAQVGRGDPERDSPALEAYALYPYLRAARLGYALTRASGGWSEIDLDTEAFLDAHADEPVAGPLQRGWLASLARRGEWQAFLDRYDPAVATEALECTRLDARISLEQTSGLEAEIVERWLTGRRLPPECEPAFQWLRDRGGLEDALVADRARLLLENGEASFSRVIARRLPDDEAVPLRSWADLIEEPAASIDALLADPTTDIDEAALLDGFARLARAAPREALARFEALTRTRLKTPDQASKAARALALGLAWDRDPAALTYFARVASADLDDYALQWLVRSALWNGDWAIASSGIGAMSAAQHNESAWRYWSGRAFEADGNDALARELYGSLANDDNYYSAQAAARLGKRVEPREERLPAEDDAIERIARQAPFVRAHELQLCGLRALATLEWHAGYGTLDGALKTQAIHLAARWGLYDIAVATATSQGVFNDYPLLYPRPFHDEVKAATKLTALDQPLLYGVLRQESLFRPDATSLAGALGLAQLRHATAQITAGLWQLPAPSRADLYDPATNIRLGAARLTTLLKKYDAEIPVALAAYNAGENAAERWLPEQPIDSDIWIENIPYNETRAYVRRVLWHSVVFDWLEHGRPKSTRRWLGQVNPAARND